MYYAELCLTAQFWLKMWRIRALLGLAWSMPVRCGIPTLRKTVLYLQNGAAKWVLKSRWDPESLRWAKSSSDCVSTLNWPSLSTRQIYFIIMFFFNVYYRHLISSIKVYLLPHFRHTRSHKLTFQTISSTINSY